MQRSWNKYGESNFNFFILDKCLPEELDSKEIKWITYYNTFNGTGYNLTVGGGGIRGYILSEETKRAISNSHKGKTLTEEHKRNLSIARRKSEKVARSENNNLHHNNRTDEFKKRMIEKYREYLSSPNFSPPNTKRVICVTTNETFNTIRNAANKYNICESNISYCCKHKRDFAGESENGIRLQWEYYEDDKSYIPKEQKVRSNQPRAIIQYDLNHNYIKKWNSAKECSEETGLQRSKISNVCHKKRKQTGGFIFEFI